MDYLWVILLKSTVLLLAFGFAYPRTPHNSLYLEARCCKDANINSSPVAPKHASTETAGEGLTDALAKNTFTKKASVDLKHWQKKERGTVWNNDYCNHIQSTCLHAKQLFLHQLCCGSSHSASTKCTDTPPTFPSRILTCQDLLLLSKAFWRSTVCASAPQNESFLGQMDFGLSTWVGDT